MRPRSETVVAVSGYSKREWSCEMNKMPDIRVTGWRGWGGGPSVLKVGRKATGNW